MSDATTILIIDDEYAILESLSAYLEDEGYNVITAENGETGLTVFSMEAVDIVLTDLRMPVMDGLEVMKTIRQKSPDTPMIVISGAGGKEDIITALRMGAKDYITKPIENLNIISHTVAQVLENKRLSDENERYRRQLEKSENRYRTITENIAEGVFTVNEDENITYTNQAFCRMTGFSQAEILQKNLMDLTTVASFKTVLEQTQNRRSGRTDRYVIEVISKDKITRHIELACSPIFSETSVYQGAIAVARDITDIMVLRRKYQAFQEQAPTTEKDVTPICANCKRIRIGKGQWIQLEAYFKNIMFSHGICPSCCKTLYGDLDFPDID